VRAIQIEQAASFYDEPHRHYHARAHIVEMFELAHYSGFALSAAQALAVLFHDAIYVPGAPRGSNESMSAQLLRVYQGSVPDPVIDLAYGIIVDTADHMPRRDESQLVLDLDLIRLGASPAQFARYSGEVFEEQRPLIALDDNQSARDFFESRRAPFFERLLAREHIYCLPEFRARYEAQARRNMRAAIARVRATGTRGTA
jgi:predicted metal-dependent HD superfamily phosphohydrolase